MPYPYSSTSVNLVADDGPISYASIDLLDNVPVKDQLKVYLDGQLKVYNTDYTIDLTLQEITMTPVVTGTVKVARVTDIENKEVTFTNSSVLTAQDLNKNTDQLLFLAQELFDKAQDIALTPAGNLVDDSIGSNLLNKTAGNEAVVTTALRDLAVTTAKIDDDAVTTAKIANNAVETAKILNLNVTTGKINDLAVTTAKLDDLAVTAAKIANATITSGKLATSLYETGTFTPIFKLRSSTGVARTSTWTYGSFNVGLWTRIGNLLFISLEMSTTAGAFNNAVNGDSVQIEDLPTGFSPNGSLIRHSCWVSASSGFVTTNPVSAVWSIDNTIRLFGRTASPAYSSTELLKENMSVASGTNLNRISLGGLAILA